MTQPAIPLRPRTIGMGALIAVCLYLSGLLVILTPLPLVYVWATSGRRNGFIAAVASFAVITVLYIVSPFSSPIPLPGLGLASHFSSLAARLFGGGYFLFFLVIALVLGEAVRSHWGLVKGGTSALLAGLALAVLAATVLQLAGVVHIVAGVKGYLEFMVSEIVRVQQSAGVSDTQTALLSEHGPEVASFVFHVIPSIVFVFALLAVVINLLFSRRFIRLPHLFSGHAWDVAAFRMSDVYVWAVIGAAIAFFAGRYLAHLDWLEFVGINGLIAMAAIYFFQGLAVTAFFLRRVRFSLLKIAAYVFIILFFQTVGVLIVGIGLSDVWVDFRRRGRKINPHDSVEN